MSKQVKENLEKVVKVRLTPSEHKLIKYKALENMIAMSTYIRMQTIGKIKLQ
jgi:hypothetical protein